MNLKNSLQYSISLIILMTISASNVFAMPDLLVNLKEFTQELLFSTIYIIHPNYVSTTEEVAFIALIASFVFLLSIIFVISGKVPPFRDSNKGPKVAFSVALSILVIYLYPFVETMSYLIYVLGNITYVLILVTIGLLIYKYGMHFYYTHKNHDKIITYLENEEKLLNKKVEHNRALNESKFEEKKIKKELQTKFENIELEHYNRALPNDISARLNLNIKQIKGIETKTVDTYLSFFEDLEIINKNVIGFNNENIFKIIYNSNLGETLINTTLSALHKLRIDLGKLINDSEITKAINYIEKEVYDNEDSFMEKKVNYIKRKHNKIHQEITKQMKFLYTYILKVEQGKKYSNEVLKKEKLLRLFKIKLYKLCKKEAINIKNLEKMLENIQEAIDIKKK